MPPVDESERNAVPVFIRSPSDLSGTVVFGATPETLVLEFKETIDGWNAPAEEVRRRAQKELCRDVSQFANTNGGVLLVGVGERTEPLTGTRVASHITPIKDVDKLIQWVEQAITNVLVPSTVSHDIASISTQSGPILAINVPASVHLVAVWDRQEHTIEYLYRTNHGKSWMNPDEAEAHLMSGSRAIKLMLEQAVARTRNKKIEIVGPICAVGSGGIDEGARVPTPAAELVGMDDHYVELKFHVHSGFETVVVPLAAIRSAWPQGHRTMLLLNGIRIVSRLSTLELVPS